MCIKNIVARALAQRWSRASRGLHENWESRDSQSNIPTDDTGDIIWDILFLLKSSSAEKGILLRRIKNSDRFRLLFL